MKLLLGQRLWNGFLHGVRVAVNPVFDEYAAVLEAEEKGAAIAPRRKQPEPEPEPTDSGYFVQRDGSGFPPGVIDKNSFSIPEGLIIRKGVWLYLNIDGEDARSWEIPLPAGSVLHMTAERKPEWAVSHPCDPNDKFNKDDN